jgi:protein gp37
VSKDSSIEWTESTWNPVTGCTKISNGCKNCYAERMAKRLKAMGNANYTNGFTVTCHEHVLDLPLSWRKPKMVFANSMSDLFHRDVPTSFIKKVFLTMNKAPWHCFQVLTKRSGRMLKISKGLNWSSNIWLGVTVENEQYQNRILELQETPASVKFLSLEPLLGPMQNIPLKGIDWVIVGGESGPGAREMKKNWAADVRDQCLSANVPFFFKQWGGVNKKKAGRLLGDRLWNQMPTMDMNMRIAEQQL